MSNVFTLTDHTGRRVRLTEERWRHINAEHPEIAADIGVLKRALRSPTTVQQRGDIRYLYRFRKPAQRYLLLVVKYLNGEGYVITAYRTREIQ